MLKKGKHIGILFSVLSIGFILITVFSILNNNKIKQYEIIEQGHDLYGVIQGKYFNRGGVFINLKGGKKILILSMNNYDYKPSEIDAFLKKGDTLVKSIKSDTLFIYRDKKKYHFVLGKDIGIEPTQK